MGFWGIAFAVAAGLCIWDFYTAVGKAIIKAIDRRQSKKKRAIGFGDSNNGSSKNNGAVARKIGFGEND